VRRRGWLALLALAVGGVLPGGRLAAQGGADSVLTGTLHLVWGDPEEGEAPRYVALLTDSSGVVRPLAVDGRDQALVTALQQLNGQRVRATTQAEALRPLSLAASPQAAVDRAVRAVAPAAGPGPGAALQAPPAWAVRVRPYAVVLCKFSDIATEPLPRQRYVDMYANAPGGTDAFFRELSRGRITLEGTTVFGWYTLPKTRAGYTTAAGEANLALMAADCVAAADAEADFSRFSGVATHYNSRIGCCSWGGSSTVSADGPARSMPFMWNMDWARAGVVAHEAGHSLGLPHSSGPYGAVYDSQWDVMSSASSGTFLNADFGRMGSQILGAYKDRLALIPDSAKVVVATGRWSGVLEPHSRAAGRNPQLLLLPVPSARGNVWMTVEARQRVGSDRSIPAEGVLLVTVDNGRSEPAQVVDADGNGDPNDAGAVWTVGERYEDAARGIVVTVDSLTSAGPAVTVERTGGGSQGLASAPRFARTGVSMEVVSSDTVVRRDSVQVLGTARWAVTNATVPSWLQLFTRSGSAPGWLVYGVRPAAAPVGRSTVTLTLLAPLGLTRPAFAIELGVVAGAAADAALLSRGGRRLTAVTGTVTAPDTVRLLLTGAFSGAPWTISGSAGLVRASATGQPFTTLTGTGSAAVVVRSAGRAAPTVAHDTLLVTVAGGAPRTLLLVDTVTVLAPPAPVALGPRRSAAAALVGVPPLLDSVRVGLATAGATWDATARRPDARVLRASGTDGDYLVWTRIPTTVGTSVDTVTVRGTDGGLALLVDTLVVRDAATRVVLARSGGSRTVVLGRGGATDSVQVGILGSAGASQSWSATATGTSLFLHRRDAFTTAATGGVRDFVRFSRVLTLLEPGRQVDTIAVNLPGAATPPALYVDTVVVVAPPVVAGDADVNGTVNGADAVAVLRHLVQLPVSPRANVRLGGDANCDGAVTVADALILLQVEAGLIPAGSCVGRPAAGG
jgi:M6 family metalloprotease-like protein